MPLFDRDEIRAPLARVHAEMAPTARITWPLLGKRVGAEVIVKHENHAPTGAFKVCGGITFIDWLKRTHPEARGIVTASRGDHGQFQARAATAAGLEAKIYVPEGNSVEKNAAMRAFGADLHVFGPDFNTAQEEAMRVAKQGDFFPMPPFHPELVRGAAIYAYELFTAHPDLGTVYVPIGCGSGIVGTITARDALGLDTQVVGVVSQQADGARRSVAAGHLFQTDTARTFAEGMAVRIPVQAAFDIYAPGAARILAVSEAEIAAAVRLYFECTHNVAEGAGAAPLAGLLQEREAMAGRKVAVVLSGGNIDTAWFARILAGGVPAA